MPPRSKQRLDFLRAYFLRDCGRAGVGQGRVFHVENRKTEGVFSFLCYIDTVKKVFNGAFG